MSANETLEESRSANEVGEWCSHFGVCGGCVMQDVAYSEQIAQKEAMLRELFGAWWPKSVSIVPSPEIWYYRNKVDMAFASKYYPEAPPKGFERETVLGFKRRECWYWPLELEECRIFSPDLPPLLEALGAWVRHANLKPYNPRRDQGLLRILLVREGKRSGQRMVVLITRHDDFDRAGFLEAVRASFPATSIQWATFSSKSEIAGADALEVLEGTPTIEEVLHIGDGEDMRRLRFLLSPLSFFQTNTLGTERLYGLIRDWVRTVAPQMLYDLYGGSGGIALSCADLVSKVESVESFAGASRDGEVNARLNGIGNVAFHTHAVEDYLRHECDAGLGEKAAVIVDPPRAGVHPKALKRLMALRPERLLYVSCKPSVLAKELPVLLETYELDGLQAVDLFPHTPHVEVVATFRARGSEG